jgi:hypothetical protein
MICLSHGRESIDVRGRDLEMEGTRAGGESAKKYLRWVLETPHYIVREECKRNRLRAKAGMRAANFETK